MLQRSDLNQGPGTYQGAHLPGRKNLCDFLVRTGYLRRTGLYSREGHHLKPRHPSEVMIKGPERAAVFDGKRGDQKIAHTEALAGSASCAHPRLHAPPEIDIPKDGTMPETVTLTLARPQGFERMSDQEFAALIKTRVAAAEETAAADRRAKGIKVLGRERILKQDWRARPKSAEPHFKLSPRVAAMNKWTRIEAITRNTHFLAAYVAAKGELAKGSRDVVFPAGTWWLRKHVKVRCVDAVPAPA